jgi:RsiW-degrading membrane proteinase PrsW (M82 family)
VAQAGTTRGYGPVPTPVQQRRWVLAPVVGLVVLAICGLVVLGIVRSSVGTAGVLVGTLCALLPVGPVVATFLWVDRWEPEPPRLLLFAFLWGACFATLTALVVNSSAAAVIDSLVGGGDVVGAVVVAPIVEEAVKGAFVVGLLLFRFREFDGVVDGVVYAGLVAAGFAFTENILYIGRAFSEDQMAGQSGAVLGVLLLRGLFSPFAHPLFTAMIGIGAGIAARSPRIGVRVAAVAIGYVLAVGLHALWNGSAPPSSCRGSRRRAGSPRARCRCCPAWPGAGAGRRPCAGDRARPWPGPSWTTRPPSPSSRSCGPASPGAPRGRPPASGTTRPSPRCSGRASPRWGTPTRSPSPCATAARGTRCPRAGRPRRPGRRR